MIRAGLKEVGIGSRNQNGRAKANPNPTALTHEVLFLGGRQAIQLELAIELPALHSALAAVAAIKGTRKTQLRVAARATAISSTEWRNRTAQSAAAGVSPDPSTCGEVGPLQLA